jgi:CheY-specific phosphatase CheX
VWESELSEPLQLIEAKIATDYKTPENVTAVIGVSGQLTGNMSLSNSLQLSPA